MASLKKQNTWNQHAGCNFFAKMNLLGIITNPFCKAMPCETTALLDPNGNGNWLQIYDQLLITDNELCSLVCTWEYLHHIFGEYMNTRCHDQPHVNIQFCFEGGAPGACVLFTNFTKHLHCFLGFFAYSEEAVLCGPD